MKFQPKPIDNQRISTIGNMMLNMPPGKKSAVCVDRGGKYEGKADWYIEKLKATYPAFTVEYVGPLNSLTDVIHVHSPACSQN
jgi:hypothetical protein